MSSGTQQQAGASPDPVARASSRRRWLEVGFLAFTALLAVLVRYPTLRQPLVEAHSFRQTQTAYTARLFHENGIDLFHPELPVLGEPWEVPFEFPLFQAAASVPMSLGIGSDASMRITALGMFMITAILTWGFMRLVTRSPVASGGAYVAFLFSPFALLWSRASLIEFMATAGAVGWALTAILWLERGGWWWLVSLVSGTAGMLVKPTTTAFWVFPVLGWVVARAVGDADGGRSRWWATVAGVRRLIRPKLLVAGAIPFIVAFAWVQYTDGIKEASPFAQYLTESGLRTWNFGSISQRTEAANWLAVADRIEPLLMGSWLGLPLVSFAFVSTRLRVLWLSVGLTALLPVAVFFNLYVVHDYYLAAITPAIAMLLGAGTAWLVRRWENRRSRDATAAILALLWTGAALWTASPYWRVAYAEQDVAAQFPAVPEILELTAPDDRIATVGLDWNPATLYYADRRGAMLKDDAWGGELGAALLADRRYEIFVAASPFTDRLDLIGAWPWVGPVGRHTYRVGHSNQSLDPALIRGTMDANAFHDAAARGSPLVTESFALECGPPVEIAQGSSATWILFAGDYDRTVRLTVGADLGPLPAMRAIVVANRPGPLTLTCSGADRMLIESIVSAPITSAP